MFRAASYYRAADFFLHGAPRDPRIRETWKNATACFDRAISLLDVPAERVRIDGREFGIPAILYRPFADGLPRPTLLLLNGFDGSQEEMLHTVGFSALERGFNVLTFEGPGQPTVLREQEIGFIAEWERVVSPVVGYAEKLACVDASRIALLGYSFGGFLAPRAAAFEHRLAAVVCVDGLFDIYQAFTGAVSPQLRTLLDEHRIDELNRAVAIGMTRNTNMRWAVEHGCWAFQASTPYEFLERTRTMSMRGLTEQIQCPVLVCEAEDDQFFAGQPTQLAEVLGERATYRRLTSADAAGEHCHVGASDFVGRVALDWLEDTLNISLAEGVVKQSTAVV
jgi:pimeloyl-ACP methyl ester carboxylesterase